jgi:hypothetical protein
MYVEPDNNISLRLNDVSNTYRSRISAVSKHDVAGTDWDPTPSLTTSHVSQFKKVALQIPQINRVMDPPVRAGAPGLGNCGGVHGSDAT